MNSRLRSIPLAIGTRLRRFFLFFLGGETLEFEAPCAPEALKASILSSRDHLQHYAHVRVWGDRVHVQLPPDFMRRRSTLAFRGIIESTPAGSRIKGGISVNLFNRLMLGLWLGTVTLISLIALRTVLIPAGGLALFWLGWLLTGLDEAEPKIIRYLSFMCANAAPATSPE
ncbi:hypothetical protein [Prosthecobacter vanneervenii]|uniref:Uncharacterized protein n=1 Tax=Prosthecobacter vanneervenii TaxID=48466 RepID=A0A7W7Y8U6_9BACT|nr:hypothetical protein [Prosthecobacter vanneervenii]MBB5031783.1 hypothetical protein [Prosthecobacter vanneervenii]